MRALVFAAHRKYTPLCPGHSFARLSELVGSAGTVRSGRRVLLGVEYGDLGTALVRLSPEMRAVVQATVLDGLTTREAARLLGIPANTVKTRLHRAKAQLRRNLAEEPA